MCGGRGSRLESSHEKPLHPIDGVAMVDRVLTALEASGVEAIYAAVSPNAPESHTYLERSDGETPTVTTLETAGDGYVADLMALLDRSAISPPVLTVAADLPLLEAPVIDRVLTTHGDCDASRTVCVPVALKRRLGASVDSTLEPETHLAPTGVNVVGDASDSQTMTDVYYDPRLAINVNRLEDARLAANELPRLGAEGR